MDIFKKLTKGISFDSKTVQPTAVGVKNKPEMIKPSIDANVVPAELDFFAEKQPVKKIKEVVDVKEPAAKNSLPASSKKSKSTCYKSSFDSQEDLENFKYENSIRLSLHQTSENSVGNESSALHHITSLHDPEQIAPVRTFNELVDFYGMDKKLLDRIEQVAKEELKQQHELADKRAELLLPVNQDEIQTIISTPTAVQMQATPVLLQGRDMIVMAPTGSGKTLAFILGIFGRLLRVPDSAEGQVRALVVSPTRELADQIHQQFMKFSPRDHGGKPLIRVGHLNKAVVNGWTAQRPSSYPHVLIATPLRLIHAIKSNLLAIENLQMLILDEADRLLADGFDEQLDELLVAMKNPAKVQKALFSATMPSGVESTARTILTAPYRIVCGSTNPNGSSLQSIDQKLIFCGNGTRGAAVVKGKLAKKRLADDEGDSIKHDESVGKMMALRQLIHQGSLTPPVLIFVGSAVRAERLFSDLIQWSASALSRPLPVDYLHAGRSQSERSSVLEAFRTGKIWFLITTDVLARGLDFPPLSAVINYDFPDSTASYIHRIGRTGRAGRSGVAYTLYTTDDLPELRIVVNVMRESGIEVSQWLQDHYTKSHGNGRLSKKLKHDKKAHENENKTKNKIKEDNVKKTKISKKSNGNKSK
jgi:ATP-dependent RNA helicase DDX52/ROK1